MLCEHQWALIPPEERERRIPGMAYWNPQPCRGEVFPEELVAGASAVRLDGEGSLVDEGPIRRQ